MKKAFRPKGVAAFRGRDGSQRAKKDYAVDRLATVESIDGKAGVMYAVEHITNQKLIVAISEEGSRVETKKNTDNKKNQKNWHGNKIDALMQEDLEPGSIVILTQCRGVNQKTIGKETFLDIKCRWIEHAADLTFKKIFPGTFTIKVNREGDAFDSAQHWDEDTIDVNDNEKISEFLDRFDTIAEAFEQNEYPVRRGYQLRLLHRVEDEKPGEKGRENRPPVYEVIEASYPIDWYFDEELAKGDAEYRGRVLTADDIAETIQAYLPHIWGVAGSDEEDEQPKYPQEILDKCRVVVIGYDNYKAGDPEFNNVNIPELVVNSQGETFALPLTQMATTKTRFADETEWVSGYKNYAVRGILRLVADVFDKKTETMKRYNMVRKLYANGLRGNILGMARAPDGGFVRVPEYLNAPREELASDGAKGLVDEALDATSNGDSSVNRGSEPFGEESFDNDNHNPFKEEDAPAAPAAKDDKPRKFQR